MRRLPAIFLVTAAALFLAGIWQLFRLRFEAGDVYPEYSSLRADPLGTQAFYESLGRLINVQRHFQQHLKAEEGGHSTLFVLGLEGAETMHAPEEFKELEDFATAGGRVVISLRPQFEQRRVPWTEEAGSSARTNRTPARGSRKAPARSGRARSPEGGSAPEAPMSMATRWKFHIQQGLAERDEKGVYRPVMAQRVEEGSLPEKLEWHTGVWFDKPDPAWRAVYAREKGRAVVMERGFGAGSLVLLSDSYYASNEAVRRHPQPALLAWLTGSSQRAIFDETHLGVSEEPGVATLARKYQLHGLAVSLFLLAGLYVWQKSARFLPPQEDGFAAEGGSLVAGRESAAGFVNLLRRNLRSSDLLGACMAEWRKSCARTTPPNRLRQVEAIAEAEQALPARQRKPVEAYRRICACLENPDLSRRKTASATPEPISPSTTP